jgi:3-hydroxymyristoyl/3-hydroxydecanoyl-(acyl carrier protein) dehydratase
VAEHRSHAEIPFEHPCLPGHFPGRPVVPAVVLMDRVLEAVHHWQGPHWRLQRMHAVKFLHPLLPGQTFEIALTLVGTRLDFRCEREDRLLAQGGWELAAGP